MNTNHEEKEYLTAEPHCHVVLKDTPSEARSQVKGITGNQRWMRQGSAKLGKSTCCSP